MESREVFCSQEETSARIKVFVGEFGSGKTELAVNYAMRTAECGMKTAVVDIDLVKPYFRTREHREKLEKKGVQVVAPGGRLAHADLPIMPQDLTRVLFSQDIRVIMDVGGAKSAVVLGQIRHQLMENGCEVWMLINVRRPFTSDVPGIIHAMQNIETVSGLRVTGLVSNTNLGEETTAEHIMEGINLTRLAASELGLPIKWVVIPTWLSGQIELPEPIFVLHPVTFYPWMEPE